jgi:hypothetical protein
VSNDKDDRGVGGILGSYSNRRAKSVASPEDFSHHDEEQRTAEQPKSRVSSVPPKRTRSRKKAEENPTTQEKENKVRCLYYLPERHTVALDEIKAELKRNRKYTPRQASYSKIVSRAIELYYEEVFPGKKL